MNAMSYHVISYIYSTLLYLRLISVIPIERDIRKTVITGLSNTSIHSNSKPLLAVVELLRMIVVIVVGVVVVVVVVVALVVVEVVRVKVELSVRELITVIT
jgi:hypothetical protein